MQKIDGQMSILVNRDYVEIEIYDKNAASLILKTQITPEIFCAMLSRLSMVNVDINIYALERVGKTHEHKSFIFEIQEQFARSSEADRLANIAQRLLDEEGEGWIADKYFGSQTSFFKKDGIQFARVTARRWV